MQSASPSLVTHIECSHSLICAWCLTPNIKWSKILDQCFLTRVDNFFQ